MTRLRLLQTSDTHMALLPYDYWTDRPAHNLGLSRTASLIRAARAEAEAANTTCLLLEGGDFLQGNPLGDHMVQLYADGQPMQPHPMMAALNALGYDAATIGNHEFNFGLEFLSDVLEQADFPVVCCNVLRVRPDAPEQNETFLPPWCILDRTVQTIGPDGPVTQPIRIGILGLTPPQAAIWDRRHLRGRARTFDMVDAARDHLPAIKAAGADIVIALNHSGIYGRRTGSMAENAGLDLAALDGIDVVLCGHQHELFPGPAALFKGLNGVDPEHGTLHGKPALMSGFWGSHLGILDLDLTRDAQGRWHVTGHRAEHRATYFRDAQNIAIPTTEEDPAIRRSALPAHEATLAYIRRPVGQTAHPLHSYFSLLGNDRSVQMVAAAQKWRVAELLEDGPLSSLPLLSAAAPFKTGGLAGPEHFTEIPAGPLTVRNLAALYQFPNDLRVVQVTGANLRDWLERAAGQFNHVIPGQPDQILCDPDFPSYNFDVIAGLDYDIDLSQPPRFDLNGDLADPAARRISRLHHNGQEVRDEQMFLIATNSYRAGGGGAFAGAGGDSVVLSLPESSFEVLRKFVASQAAVDLPLQQVWGFAPLPGTSVLYDTNPRALAYLDDLPSPAIDHVGDGAPGYTRFRLHL